MVSVLLAMAMVTLAAVEFVLARRLGGDPVKMARDPSGTLAPVIANPAAREGTRVASPNANGVTVIHGAQPPGVVHQRPQQWPPQARARVQGAAAPTPTSSYNGKPIPFDPGKSPLRSSMKKKRHPKQRADDSADSGVTIIQNRSASSPPRGKKVRINTLDTAV